MTPKPDTKAIRDRLDRAKATKALIGVDHETTLALLDALEAAWGRIRELETCVRCLEIEQLARGLEHDDDCPAFGSSAPCECYLQHWRAALNGTPKEREP